MKLLAIPLGWLMKGCYMLVKNYGLALLLFTVATRLITLPFYIKQQKSTARMTMLQPEIEKLKKKYGKNQEKLNEETMKLYSENNVNPMAGCLPMIVPLIILWALIPVVYGPLTYISAADKDNVSADSTLVKNLYTISAEIDSDDSDLASILETLEAEDEEAKIEELGEKLSDKDNYPNSAKIIAADDGNYSDSQLRILNILVNYEGIDKFITDSDNFTQNMMKSTYGPEVLLFNFETKADGQYLGILNEDVQQAIKDFNYTAFGLELGKIPTKKDATVMIPIMSFILQLACTIVSQIFSRKNNPDMKVNGNMLMMLLMMPLLSLWIGFRFPCALGIYWIYSSLFALAQVFFLNIVYSPVKLREIAAEEAKKAKEKRKKKGPSFMERAIEIRNEQGENIPSLSEAKKKASGEDESDDDDSYDGEEKLSKAQIKERNRQKLNEARKRYAEKYGDEYKED